MKREKVPVIILWNFAVPPGAGAPDAPTRMNGLTVVLFQGDCRPSNSLKCFRTGNTLVE